MEVLHELQTLLQPSEDGELPVERVSSKEEIKHGVVVDFARFPVRVGHRDLVEIWNGNKDSESIHECWLKILIIFKLSNFRSI